MDLACLWTEPYQLAAHFLNGPRPSGSPNTARAVPQDAGVRRPHRAGRSHVQALDLHLSKICIPSEQRSVREDCVAVFSSPSSLAADPLVAASGRQLLRSFNSTMTGAVTFNSFVALENERHALLKAITEWLQ